MKQTITKSMFIDDMMAIRPDNFSYEGLGIIFDCLEEIEQDCGKEMEFDPIAICCDFSQCSLREFAEAFGLECSDDELAITVIGYVESNGFFYSFLNDDKEIVFQNF
jgi:hypothetical protein